MRQRLQMPYVFPVQYLLTMLDCIVAHLLLSYPRSGACGRGHGSGCSEASWFTPDTTGLGVKGLAKLLRLGLLKLK